MSRYRFTSSRPTEWVEPRAHTDAGLRRHTYGPIQPMDYKDSIWQRLRRFFR